MLKTSRKETAGVLSQKSPSDDSSSRESQFENRLFLYNTLSRKIERFEPIDKNNVRMYVCGPTVYDKIHIGNARPIIVFDVLYRILKSLYKNAAYVRNITDVDDKIYNAAVEKNVGVSELTETTIAMYREDISQLNVLPVAEEPRVTKHIAEIVEFIKGLITNGNAYFTNGHVFFDVSSFDRYGALSKKNMDELLSGARVEVSDLKRNSLDFVLWKPIDEKFKLGWESPWGIGRPGWHIECSAMSLKYLGECFDIHGGGIDLVFPHHENEIAQSCALSRKPFMANYWIHNGHLNVDGVKMSKSLGNFFTVRELLEKYDGEVIRTAFLTTHYAAPMNFSLAALEQAKNILARWYTAIRNVSDKPVSHETFEFENSSASRRKQGLAVDKFENDFFNALLDNLNTPKAVSILNEVVNEINKSKDSNLAAAFVNICRRFLGVMTREPEDWFCSAATVQKDWIESKIKERTLAKNNKDYQKADTIRDELLKNGVAIEDTKDGTIWKTNS
ncbi:MAG: cysteine--tRNA ligase [Holosporales bacterium]|jgi:cysteinyl-tRNA synthetase|nr:cysteine--tRNA ligase [Holosporales bacterium]